MTFGTYERVRQLLEQVKPPPEQRPPTGAAPDQLAFVEHRLGYSLPAELRRWLGMCNGYIAGEGFLYGARPSRKDLDIAYMLELRPEWRSRRWIPVANDGFGNGYVLDCSDEVRDPEAVYFVDVAEPCEVACVVASSLPRFLTFYLETELGERQKLWPIDQDYVLERDPELASIDARLLLWNQD